MAHGETGGRAQVEGARAMNDCNAEAKSLLTHVR